MIDLTGVLPSNFTPPQRTVRFRAVDKVEVRGIDYRGHSQSKYTVVLRRMDQPDVLETFSQADIQRMWNDPTGPLRHFPKFYDKKTVEGRVNSETALRNLKEERQDSAIRKETWAKAAIKWEEERILERLRAAREGKRKPPKFTATSWYALDRELPKIRAELEKRMNTLFADGATYRHKQVLVMPSGTTLAGWVASYKASAFDPLALCDDYDDRRPEYFNPDELVFLNEALRLGLSTTKPSLTALHLSMERKMALENELRAKIGIPALRIPSYECLRARWHRLPHATREIARLGPEDASASLSATGRGIDVLRPLEVVEMDEYKTDLQSILVDVGIWEKMSREERAKIKRVRLWITAAICVATRTIVGLRVHWSAPNLISALTTLEMTTLDKTYIAKQCGCTYPWDMYGTLEQLSVDSAAWLSSKPMRVAVNDLDADFFLPASGDASMRGTIERWFKTLGHLMFNFFTGRTWHSVDERGTYKSEKLAATTADMVAQCLIRFVVDGYHNREHDGLWRATPRQRWKQLEEEWGVLPEPDAKRRREIFGITFVAKLGRHGVRKIGLDYNSRQLRDAFKNKKSQELLCRLDRHDIFSLSVFLGKGWVTVPCQYPELQGMTLAKFVAACTRLKLFNKANAKSSRQAFLDTMGYLETQPEVARIAAEVLSPFMDERDLARIDKALERGIQFDEAAPVVDLRGDEEWIPSDDFFEIMGIQPIVYANPPEKVATKALARPTDDGRDQPAGRDRAADRMGVLEHEKAPKLPRRTKAQGVSTMFDDET